MTNEWQGRPGHWDGQEVWWIQEGAITVAMALTETDATRILADHKAAEELAAVKAELRDVRDLIADDTWVLLQKAPHAAETLFGIVKLLGLEEAQRYYPERIYDAVADLKAQLAEMAEALTQVLASENDTYRQSDDRWSVIRQHARALLSRYSTQKAEG